MKEDMILDKFQYTVDELLVRNKSILDIITKFQESCGGVNRSIVKSTTQCGCTSISACKQEIDESSDFQSIKASLKTHLNNNLCDQCRDIVEKEIGKTLFYLASLCNTLDLNMYDVILKELDRFQVLGNYNLR